MVSEKREYHHDWSLSFISVIEQSICISSGLYGELIGIFVHTFFPPFDMNLIATNLFHSLLGFNYSSIIKKH